MSSVPHLTRLHISLQRLARWEFWPWQVIYFPVSVYWFFLAVRARGWVFFSAANPCMKFGGLVAYSKWEVLKLIPTEFIPRTIVIDPHDDSDETVRQAGLKDMTCPLIIKPDMGERGRGVRIIKDEDSLRKALRDVRERMLLQTFEDLPMELGILYSRHPYEKKGRITSVVIKEFPVLIGDGKSSLLQLILGSIRTRLNYRVLTARFRDRLEEVPKKGETIEMVKLGNHLLGTTFLNGNHLITDELEDVFDSLAKQMEGFFIGRFDIRTSSIENLKQGNFKVIEANGVNSEPAHIYDPNMPLWKGLKDLLRHWEQICSISMANHRNGVPYASFKEITAEIGRHSRNGAERG